MDQVVHGTVEEADGTVDLADAAGADSYGVVDEIARRVLLSGGEVLSVRQADIPEGKPLAAVLRYAL
jgi:glycine cleavage system regulatory protein